MKSKNVLSYIWGTTKNYRIAFGFLFLTVIFSTITGALFPYATGKIVDAIFYKNDMKTFLKYFLLYAGLYLINQCFHGGLNYIWAQLKVTYIVDIRKNMFSHLLKLKASIWRNISSGDVMKRITEDTECFLEFIHQNIFYTIANIMQLFISIGYLFVTNKWLGFVAVLITPILVCFIRFFSYKLKKVLKKYKI